MKRLMAVVVSLACSAPAGTALAATEGAGRQPGYELARLWVDGHLVVARWNPCTTIRYRVDTRYLPVSKQRKRRAAQHVRRGFRKLAAATGLRFRREPIPRGIRLPTIRSWGKGPSDTVTVTFMRPSRRRQVTSVLPVDPRTGRRYGGYTLWNSAPGRSESGAPVARIRTATIAIDGDQYVRHPWGYRRGKATGTLILHELGHAVGLMHVPDRTQVLFGGRIRDSRHPAAYQRGDRAGLRLLGAEQGCVR